MAWISTGIEGPIMSTVSLDYERIINNQLGFRPEPSGAGDSSTW